MSPSLDAPFFRALPRCPGVYFMLDRNHSILYIGKAVNLRARLMTYRRAALKLERRDRDTGDIAPNVRGMLARLDSIRWEEHRSEAAAFARENELLHALRPPHNIASTDPVEYFFLGVRAGALVKRKSRAVDSADADSERVRLSFQLSGEVEKLEEYTVFGCFQHRRRTKEGYTALLRLLYAAQVRDPRFSFPAKIAREAPPYLYVTEVPRSWVAPIQAFLRGRNIGFIRHLTEKLVENECIPRFMRASLQEDIERVRDFYRRGPRTTRAYRLRGKLRARILSHQQMDDLIGSSVLWKD